MNKTLRFRTIVFGLLGVILITSSSMYVALRMGALPWPTLFVTILSLVFLRKAKDSSIQEITVCHTMMSSGSMVAGAIAFTIPGIWIINENAKFSILSLITLSISGAISGLVYTVLLKDKLIVKDKTPFPIGVAAYETLIAGFNKTKSTVSLFVSMAFSSIFSFLRDGFNFIPSVLQIIKPTSLTPSFSFWLSPMALAIGSLIGLVYSLTWFGSSLVSNFIVLPILVKTNTFSYQEATRYLSNLGLGLMVGCGVFMVLKSIFKTILNLFKKNNKLNLDLNKKKIILTLTSFTFIIILLLLTTDLKLYQIILTIILMGFTTYISGMLTGQTGVNPMEIMGILTLLTIGLISMPSTTQAFTICSIVSIACGLVGDVTNDLKSGYLSNTKTSSLLLSETIGAIFGCFISILVLLLLKKAYNGFNNDFLITPQAHAVSAMIKGLEFPSAFFIGAFLSIVLSFFKLPVATLGLGVYLPFCMSSIVALGSVLNYFSLKLYKDKNNGLYNNRLISSGLLAGEGLTGVIIAIIMILR